MRKLSLFALAATAGLLAAAQASANTEVESEADLDGSQQVPAVSTALTGEVTVEIEDGELEFELEVEDNAGFIVAAHIHCAAPGFNGPVGVTLFSALDSGVFTDEEGTLAEGVLTAPDGGNGCGWADLDAVAAAIVSGGTYVNVHTFLNLGGEIRGNLPGGDDD